MSPIADPAGALADVVREVEAHAARSGWDQPAQLFALVETADLVEREPHLAEVLGVERAGGGPHPGRAGDHLGEPRGAAVHDPVAARGGRLCRGAGGDDGAARTPSDVPDDAEAAAEYAASHPQREEARIVAGSLRSGESFCAIRQRAHDDDDMVLAGPDLVPALLELLQTTLQPDAGDPEYR